MQTEYFSSSMVAIFEPFYRNCRWMWTIPTWIWLGHHYESYWSRYWRCFESSSSPKIIKLSSFSNISSEKTGISFPSSTLWAVYCSMVQHFQDESGVCFMEARNIYIAEIMVASNFLDGKKHNTVSCYVSAENCSMNTESRFIWWTKLLHIIEAKIHSLLKLVMDLGVAFFDSSTFLKEIVEHAVLVLRALGNWR